MNNNLVQVVRLQGGGRKS